MSADTTASTAAIVNAGATAAAATPAPTAADPREEMFARKERQLNQMRQQLKQQEAAMAAKYAKYDTDYIPKSRLLEDPLSVLNENGHDYNKLTELMLNQPNQNDPTVRALRAEIKAIAEKQAAAERAQEAAVSQQFEQAKKQIDTEAKMLIDSDPEFETTKAQGMQEAVTEYIIEKFNETGVLMDVREAALKVEDALIKEGLKFAQLAKIQAKMASNASQAAAAAPAVTAPKAAYKQPHISMKTLTHSATVSTGRNSGEKERIARAMAAFHGQLK